MLAKKIRREAFGRGFVGNGFCAVLAKLCDLPVAIGTRPGAALAIEPVLLVNVKQSFETARYSHLANGKPGGLDHCRQTGRYAGRVADFGCIVRYRLRAGRWI